MGTLLSEEKGVTAANGFPGVRRGIFVNGLEESTNELCLEDKDKKTIKYHRIGRLVHPYLTAIQEGFGHYISRHGMIRHPDEILSKYKKTLPVTEQKASYQEEHAEELESCRGNTI